MYFCLRIIEVVPDYFSSGVVDLEGGFICGACSENRSAFGVSKVFIGWLCNSESDILIVGVVDVVGYGSFFGGFAPRMYFDISLPSGMTKG